MKFDKIIHFRPPKSKKNSRLLAWDKERITIIWITADSHHIKLPDMDTTHLIRAQRALKHRKPGSWAGRPRSQWLQIFNRELKYRRDVFNDHDAYWELI